MKEMDLSQQEEEEEEQRQNIEPSQQDEFKEEEDKQVEEGDIQRAKRNMDGAEIATNDQLQPAQEEEEKQPQNIHKQSQEESNEVVEEGENKKGGDGNLEISVQREKKSLDGANGRTFSRHVQTQQYLDSLIRGNDTNLEDGLSMAIGGYFREFRRYPDVDYNVLIWFVTDRLGLIDVPPRDLRNLMHIIGELRENIQAEMMQDVNLGRALTEMMARDVEVFNSLDQTMWNTQDGEIANVLGEKAMLSHPPQPPQQFSLTSEQDYMDMNLDAINLDGNFRDDENFSIDPEGFLLDESQDKRESLKPSKGPVAEDMANVLDEKAMFSHPPQPHQDISLTSELDYMEMNLDTINLDGDFRDDENFSIDPEGFLLDEKATLSRLPQPHQHISLTSENDNMDMNLDAINLDGNFRDDVIFSIDSEGFLLYESQDKSWKSLKASKGPVAVEVDPVPPLGNGQPAPEPGLLTLQGDHLMLGKKESQNPRPRSHKLRINVGEGLLQVSNGELTVNPRFPFPNSRLYVQVWEHFRGLLPIDIRMTQEMDLERFMQQFDRPGSLPPDLQHTISSEQFQKPEDEKKDQANKKQKKK